MTKFQIEITPQILRLKAQFWYFGNLEHAVTYFDKNIED